jgi:hypothetical protein
VPAFQFAIRWVGDVDVRATMRRLGVPMNARTPSGVMPNNAPAPVPDVQSSPSTMNA